MIEARGRDLTRTELRAVVVELAERRETWEPWVRHDPAERVYRELHRDDHLAVWLICWMQAHDTGFHDHDRSSGAVAVVRGGLREQRLRLGVPPSSARIWAGGAFDFSASDIHRVTSPGPAPAVSLHAYSPPLRGMGSYLVDDSGDLRRLPLAPGDELRPLSV